MTLQIVILLMSVIITGLIVWVLTSKHYQKQNEILREENFQLKSQVGLNENIINEVKVAFSKIAQESLKNQQEALLSEHANDLKNRIELFKAEEITPVNRLLKEFKDSIDNYQKSHQNESLEIKNAIATAEKYARALTMNQNSKGEFGEDWLEQIFKFANLEENVHYTKQFVSDGVKPDFVVNLPNSKNIIIDSKVILKNFLEYRQSEDNEILKKAFITDLTNCITSLAKKNYEEIDEIHQPGFILMYIPVETCINMIYTDFDFRKVIELANSRNIIIVGTSSLLVTLRLVNQLWASQVQYDNVQNIITVGQNLYNNIASHAQNLMNIQQTIDKASASIKTELNRFTARKNGSIFKEAEKLRDFGISSKEIKSGKKIVENAIPEIFLADSESEIQEDKEEIQV
ncbi:DNA recombination protein RmuC [bacterium]|nr:DNA recombination protein RmuC [bacterium]